jgi:hypothetical protein
MVGYFVGRRAKRSHGKLTHLVHEDSGWSACGAVKSGPWERLIDLPGWIVEPTCKVCLRTLWHSQEAEGKVK